MERIQFPFKLYWTITILKSQELTQPNAWINLDMQEKSALLGFIAITRVKSLNNLIDESIWFERLAIVRSNNNFRLRCLEQSRLNQWCKNTLEMNEWKYLHDGLFICCWTSFLLLNVCLKSYRKDLCLYFETFKFWLTFWFVIENFDWHFDMFAFLIIDHHSINESKRWNNLHQTKVCFFCLQGNLLPVRYC